MSEKIELIPAAELPVAESDDVEALVIEGGELKRKEVGGEVKSVNGVKPDEHGNVNAGEKVDLIIEHNRDFYLTGNLDPRSYKFNRDGIKDVMTAYAEGRRPIVKFVHYYNPYTPDDICTDKDELNYTIGYSFETDMNVYRYGTTFFMSFLYPDPRVNGNVFKHCIEVDYDGIVLDSACYMLSADFIE